MNTRFASIHISCASAVPVLAGCATSSALAPAGGATLSPTLEGAAGAQ